MPWESNAGARWAGKGSLCSTTIFSVGSGGGGCGVALHLVFE